MAEYTNEDIIKILNDIVEDIGSDKTFSDSKLLNAKGVLAAFDQSLEEADKSKISEEEKKTFEAIETSLTTAKEKLDEQITKRLESLVDADFSRYSAEELEVLTQLFEGYSSHAADTVKQKIGERQQALRDNADNDNSNNTDNFETMSAKELLDNYLNGSVPNDEIKQQATEAFIAKLENNDISEEEIASFSSDNTYYALLVNMTNGATFNDNAKENIKKIASHGIDAVLNNIDMTDERITPESLDIKTYLIQFFQENGEVELNDEQKEKCDKIKEFAKGKFNEWGADEEKRTALNNIISQLNDEKLSEEWGKWLEEHGFAKNNDKDNDKEKAEKAFQEQYGLDYTLNAEEVQENLKALNNPDIFPSTEELFSKDDNGEYKYPEFKEVAEILQKMHFIDKDGKPVDDKAKKDDIGLILQQIRNETEMYVANAYNQILPEDAHEIREEYAARLQVAVVQLAAVDGASKGKSKEEIAETIQNLYSQKDPIKIDRTTLVGWQASKQASIEKAQQVWWKKLGKKGIEATKSLSAKIAETDKRLLKQYPNLYPMAKSTACAFVWGAAYGTAAVSAAYVMPIVATVGTSFQVWDMIKDYKLQKTIRDNAIKNGTETKPLGFGEYCKNNKLRCAGVLLSASGAVASYVSYASYGHVFRTASDATVVEKLAILKNVRFGAGVALAFANATTRAGQAYKDAKKQGKNGLWAATKAFGWASAGFVLGMFAGKAASGMGSAAVTAGSATTDTPSTPAPETQVETPSTPETPNNSQDQFSFNNFIKDPDYTMGANDTPDPNAEWAGVPYPEDVTKGDLPENKWAGIPYKEDVTVRDAENMLHDNGNDNSSSAQPETATAEVSTSTIDLNNLTDEQKHDLKMLVLRDPAEANQLLGQEGKEWMNSRQLQEAWDNGTITDEQKTALLKFAEQRFDEKGHFQDVDGYKSAEQMEADARNGAHHSRATTSNSGDTNTQTVVEEVKNDPVVEEVKEDVKNNNEEAAKTATAEGEKTSNVATYQDIQVDKKGNITATIKDLHTDREVTLTFNSEGKVIAGHTNAHTSPSGYFIEEKDLTKTQLKIFNNTGLSKTWLTEIKNEINGQESAFKGRVVSTSLQSTVLAAKGNGR